MLAEILLPLSNKKSQSLVSFVILFMTSTPRTRLTPLGILKCCNIRHTKKTINSQACSAFVTLRTINNCSYKGLRFSTDHEKQSQLRFCIFHISFPHALYHLILTNRQPVSSHGRILLRSKSLAQVTRNTILYALSLLSITFHLSKMRIVFEIIIGF